MAKKTKNGNHEKKNEHANDGMNGEEVIPVKKSYPVKDDTEQEYEIFTAYKDGDAHIDKNKIDLRQDEKKNIQKKSMIGLEIEMFTLDNEGRMINAADKIINTVKKKYPKVDIKKECGKSMIELASFPNEEISNTMLNLIESMESILLCAEKENITIFPLATYPGVFTPEMRSDKPYRIKEQIFGKKRFMIAGRCVGFHCHYTLPWGVFDSKEKILKKLSAIAVKEQEATVMKQEIEERKKDAETPRQKRKIERKRWIFEKKRRVAEKNKWNLEAKLNKKKQELKQIEINLERVLLKEQGLFEKQKKVLWDIKLFNLKNKKKELAREIETEKRKLNEISNIRQA